MTFIFPAFSVKKQAFWGIFPGLFGKISREKGKISRVLSKSTCIRLLKSGVMPIYLPVFILLYQLRYLMKIYHFVRESHYLVYFSPLGDFCIKKKRFVPGCSDNLLRCLSFCIVKVILFL